MRDNRDQHSTRNAQFTCDWSKNQLTACCIFLTNHTAQYKLTASFWQFIHLRPVLPIYYSFIESYLTVSKYMTEWNMINRVTSELSIYFFPDMATLSKAFLKCPNTVFKTVILLLLIFGTSSSFSPTNQQHIK